MCRFIGRAWVALCVLLFAIAASGQAVAAGNKNNASGKTGMKIISRHVQFQIPQGYQDTSNYSFKTKNDKKLLSVNYDQVKAGSHLNQVYSDKKAGLLNAMGNRINVIEEGRANLAGHDAMTLVIHFKEGDVDYYDHWAIALLEPKTSVLISYALDKHDAPTFNHILATASLLSSPTIAAKKGFYRYQAERLMLDVPQDLQAPNIYTISSADGQVKVTISLYTSDEKRPKMNLQEYMKWDSGNGVKKIVDLSEQRVALADGGGEQINYIIDYSSHPYAPTVSVAYRAEITIGATWIYLHGTTVPNKKSELNSAWNDVLNTLTKMPD